MNGSNKNWKSFARYQLSERILNGNGIAILPKFRGPQLPLGTDTYIAKSVGRLVASKVDLIINFKFLKKVKMTSYRSLSALIITFSSILTMPLKANNDFASKTYTSTDGKTLNYRIHIPAKINPKNPCPLVLLLHGSGERGNDNTRQLVYGAKPLLAYSQKNNIPLIIVAPQCPKGESWANTSRDADTNAMPKKTTVPMMLTIELMQKLITTLPVDPNRIYVTGLSMGGFGTWDIIQRKPNMFAAAIPICGGGDTNMVSVIKNIPIWVFHGGSDGVVETKCSRDMVAALKKVGSKVKYTEYEGVGHFSWKRTYSNDKVLKWFLSQKNNTNQTDTDCKPVQKP